MEPFQGVGLGSRLLRYGENVLTQNGFLDCEIGVERSNKKARQLYERLGYQLTFAQLEEYFYVTPAA
jgi:ribosomal protein S18 acetylase RimI-like enzyme